MQFKSKTFIILILLMNTWGIIFANNLQVSNVIRTGQDVEENTILIDFDIRWENSWRTDNLNNDGITNWDAVWIFIKYQKENDGK